MINNFKNPKKTFLGRTNAYRKVLEFRVFGRIVIWWVFLETRLKEGGGLRSVISI